MAQLTDEIRSQLKIEGLAYIKLGVPEAVLENALQLGILTVRGLDAQQKRDGDGPLEQAACDLVMLVVFSSYVEGWRSARVK